MEVCEILGSCFANDIGGMLQKNGVNAIVNPTGTLFHPNAILNNLQTALNPGLIDSNHFVWQESIVNSLDFHASNFGISPEDFVEKITDKLILLKDGVKKSKYIVLTLGTAFQYQFKADGKMIVNCQKQPADQFLKMRSSVDEVVNQLNAIYSLIAKHNDNFELLLTVSPVRHSKEGLHENNLSKSTLLLAVEQLSRINKIHYFPAYELVIDTLRDYRFYEQDRVHVNQEGRYYIYKKMVDFAYSDDREILNEVESINKKLAHRAIHPEKPSAVKFQKHLDLEVEQLRKKLPYWQPIPHQYNS